MKRFFILVQLITFSLMLHAAVPSAQETVKLPAPRIRGQVMKALKNRTSIKGFKNQELPEKVLSDVLWAGFGVADTNTGRRTAQSAFNVQEIDIYILKSDGVFLYDAAAHGLKQISSSDIRSYVATQGYAKSAPVQLLFVADHAKTDAVYPGSYDEQKALWAMMHAGFISQNVILYCSVNKMTAVVRSFGNREALRKELKLRDNQAIVITQAIGYSPR